MRFTVVTSIKSKRFDRSRVRTTGTRRGTYIHTVYVPVPESIVEKTRPCKRYILLYFTFYFIWRDVTHKKTPPPLKSTSNRRRHQQRSFSTRFLFFSWYFFRRRRPSGRRRSRGSHRSQRWQSTFASILFPRTGWHWAQRRGGHGSLEIQENKNNKNNTPPQQHRNRQKNNITEENQGVSVFCS